jgi:AraC-like DNA-binding protein
MFAEETGEHTFMDLVYKKELLGSGFKKHPEIQNGFENSYKHIPHRFTGQRLFLSLPMHAMLTGMRNYRNATIPLENYLMAEMPKYLSCALGEIGNFDTTRYGIKYKYWEACTRIKEYIANNLDNDFTIRSLVRIAQINGTSIKQEFRRITGFTVESYRLYLKLKRSFKELAIPDAQIKFMNDIAGYEGASTFTRGFKRRLLCLPSEFNTDEWDITNIEKIVRSAH